VFVRFDRLWERAEEMVNRAGRIIASSETTHADDD
jgi:hypothetical protein